MYEYKHGGNAAFEPGNENVIDLSANINPLGIPEGVSEAIQSASEQLNQYPDSYSSCLRARIGEYEQVDLDWVICANGASDIIFRLPRALAAQKTMVTAPSFSDYQRAAESFGSELSYFKLSETDEFIITHDLIDHIVLHKPDLLFICNPNNPTGQITSSDLIAEILEACLDLECTVAIDECFLDFVLKCDRYSAKRFLSRYHNLIILKAFTKTFAMPGIRLGYALTANDGLRQKLYYHGPDWAVSNLAQAAGIAALDNWQDYLNRSIDYIAGGRAALTSGLQSLGFKVFRSYANYVFIHNPFCFDLKNELDSYGIRIRSCADYPGLDTNYYRIAVSTHEHTAELLQLIGLICMRFSGVTP
ncbi:MAG: aminotransferase class I/II-fold pyridoxal phosphate-dependent enzyme [Coriobacteriia bacterium]|nr:aminotransferase class I/II-fold pyridoxal phosphate-dependent enzyme [Coriobacteriia bacterium]